MKVTPIVEDILRNHANARNSDRALFLHFMQKQGMELTRRQVEIFRDMPSLESVRRIRQKLQEQGKFEADTVVKTERSRKAMVLNQAAPAYNAENISRTINTPRVLPWGKG